MKNMEDFVEEVLYGKVKKKKHKKIVETKVDIKKILEADEKETPTEYDKEDKKAEEKEEKEATKEAEKEKEEEEEITDDDSLIKVSLRVNKDNSFIKLSEEDYKNNTLTDFVSLMSLFKNAKKVNIKKLLSALGLGGEQPTPGIPQTESMNEAEGPSKSEAKPKETSDIDSIINPPKEEPKKNVKPADLPEPKPKKDEFKLNNFRLSVEELVSQSGNSEVSINGNENINGMLSFKVSIDENSTPFNMPEPAISHFNGIFFNNIVATIDKELEKRRNG